MPRYPKIEPAKWLRIGSDAASIQLFDELRLCGALDVLETLNSADGTVTHPVFGLSYADPSEPLGYGYRFQLRNGRFRPDLSKGSKR